MFGRIEPIVEREYLDEVELLSVWFENIKVVNNVFSPVAVFSSWYAAEKVGGSLDFKQAALIERTGEMLMKHLDVAWLIQFYAAAPRHQSILRDIIVGLIAELVDRENNTGLLEHYLYYAQRSKAIIIQSIIQYKIGELSLAK
ncbi:MAG: hypothetical protein WCO55_03930 [Candidatus Falkowbacteria bacterium]